MTIDTLFDLDDYVSFAPEIELPERKYTWPMIRGVQSNLILTDWRGVMLLEYGHARNAQGLAEIICEWGCSYLDDRVYTNDENGNRCLISPSVDEATLEEVRRLARF